MTALLSNATALSSIGIIVLAVSIIVAVVWLCVLSVKVSKLKRIVMMERERTAEMAQFLTANAQRSPHAPKKAPVAPRQAAPAPVREEAAREEKPKKQRGRKGKPTIPFGANKEAQSRAQQVYTQMADEAAYDPDSIDFNKVEGLRSPDGAEVLASEPHLKTMAADAQTVRPAAKAAPSAASRPPEREREPQMRVDAQKARQLDQQATGRMPTVGVREATSETRASFDRVGEELRSRNGTSSAWIEEDARRIVERHERQARRQRMSERRQEEQLRRQAASIVAEHQRNSANL